MNNHFFYKCRAQEKVFNDCVFDKLVWSSLFYICMIVYTHAFYGSKGLTKFIPETPEGQEQIHLKKEPLFK